MSNFHVHSDYSVRDSIQPVRKIAEFQRNIGKDWFCITDHGSMASHPESFQVAKEMGMKFYPGCEFYVQPDPKFDAKINNVKVAELSKKIKRKTITKEEKDETIKELEKIRSVKGFNQWYNHITVIAFNKKGLDNLYKINNNGDFYYKTRVSMEDIAKYNEGLILMTGCPAGHFLKMIEFGYFDEAKSFLEKLKNIFGDRVYFELMFHDGIYDVEVSYKELEDGTKVPTETDEEISERKKQREIEIYSKGIEIARELDVKIVANNDSHYTTPENKKYWKLTRMAMIGKDSDFTGVYHMLRDNSIFAEVYKGLITEEELDASEEEISARLEKFEMDKASYCSSQKDKEEFERLVWTGYKNKRIGTEFEKRSLMQVAYELAVIQIKNFDKYFLSTRDIVKSAFEKGILVGPGRGSGAGSECVYLTDITKTDPLKYELMFERFLNAGRNAMPDIDLDLESNGCVNFLPDDEYKDKFFVSHQELVSDEEIEEYWEEYRTLKEINKDYRRDSVFEMLGLEYFDGFIGNKK